MVVFLFSQNEAYAAVAYGSSGNADTGTTSLSVPYPAGIAAGNLLVLVVGNKYPANGPATPVGWTLVAQGYGGLGSAGNDSGQVYATVFVKETLGTEPGNLAVTLTSANTSMARMFRYTKAAGTTWDYAATTGSDGVADKSWSVTGAANPGITSGDVLIVGSSLNGNQVTRWTESILATGATIGAGTERNDSTSGSGNDMGLIVSEHPVTAGTAGTAAAAPVYSMTGANGTPTANSPTGASVILRIREVPPLPTVISIAPTTGSTAGGTSVTITGTNFTGTPTVTIGGANATSVVVVSPTSITATTPAGTAGARDVVVTTSGGSGTGTGLFTYVTPPQASCNTGTISGIINTYYPGTASVAAGATAITVGAGSGAATALAQGDLILVMQMQDAAINTSNTSGNYGAASSVNAGLYEYATVASVVGNTVNLTAILKNGYTAASYGASGQKTFQVIRVPVYSSASLAAGVMASAWNGSTGGVLVFDVTGALNLNNVTADVSGKGFRGGGGRMLSGGTTGTSADYRTVATNNANGSKGEGIAGTPRYVNNVGSLLDTIFEGYPSGSYAKGAPANAGGGGTDNNPPQNNQNTGGGGGANGGAGGMGGYAWSASTSPGRGIGGAAVSSSAGQLTLGGGGGAATTNDGTGSPGSGFASSGAAGGGIVMIRAGSLSGTGTINVNGANANNTVTNDGSGGGGAGGSVLVYAASGLSGLTVTATGGTGGVNTGGGSAHGPGGGGGGGYVNTSSSVASNVTGGGSGTTAGNISYGATPGSAGSSTSALLAASITGAALGQGPCASTLNHYAIGHSGAGLTCEAEPITITAHDSSDNPVGAAGRTITLTAKNTSGGAAIGTWVVSADSCSQTCYDSAGASKSCQGSFTSTAGNNGVATYAFATGESGVRLCLKQNSAITENINITDGSVTEAGTEDPNLVFGNTGIRFYAGGNVDTLGNLVAGLGSAATDASYQPSPQTLTIRALKSTETTPPRCVSLLGNAPATKTIQFAYQCIDPVACHPSSDGLEVNGTVVAGSSAVPTPASNVSVVFDVAGSGSINLKYWDVGQIKLYAQGAIADPTTGGTVTITTGASNTFLVRPYSFSVMACTGATPCTTANTSATNGTGAAFATAGATFKATVKAVAYGGSVVTPSFGLGTVNGTEPVQLSHTLIAPSGGFAGTLGGTTSILRSGFSSGVASVADLTWNEVGVVTLSAINSTFEATALSPAATGTSGNIGRFIPDHFDTVATGPMTCTGLTFATACPAGGLTYSGQPFSVQVTARNALGTITQNYAGGFAKATTLSAVDASGGNAIAATAPGGSLIPVAVVASSFVSGTNVTTLAKPVFSFAATPTVPTNVFVRAIDADGVSSLRVSASSSVEGGVKVVSGRIKFPNMYGSERLPLPMTATVQFYDPNGYWVTSSTDSTSAVAVGTPVIVKGLLPLGSLTSAIATDTCLAPSKFCAGLKTVVWSSSNVAGSANIFLTVPAYLPILPARATFGIYKSSLIYRRENY